MLFTKRELNNLHHLCDSIKDSSDPIVVEFKGNKHLVNKLKELAKEYSKHKIRPILAEEKDFNPKMSNKLLFEAAKELKIKLKDS